MTPAEQKIREALAGDTVRGDLWMKIHLPSTVRELLAEIDRLRADLARCGKDNCLGQRSEGMALWVREEAMDAAVLTEREACAAMVEAKAAAIAKHLPFASSIRQLQTLAAAIRARSADALESGEKA